MSISIRDIAAKAPWRALASLGLIAVAGIVAGGCVVRVEEPVYRERVVHRESVAVEESQPQVVVEPVAQVVYEPAPVEVVSAYEVDLGPHGHWVDCAPYGRCWVWNGLRAGWRPYSVGHWVFADGAWLWVSEGEEAEWGATCYHYGRWHEAADVGWVWVPGRVWAPSWCAWRVGGGYSCWAPLPPECGDGHIISAEVVDRYCPRERFVCVETRNITNVHIHETIIVNNVTIVNKTTNITNITYVNNRAVNRGVDVKVVEQAIGHRVVAQKSIKVNSPEEAHRQIALGHAVVYTPSAVATYHASHPIGKHPPEHKEVTGRQPEVEHKAVEHTEVEHKTIEKKPEIEHKTVEHTEVEHKTAEKKPEIEHKTVEHTEVEHKTAEKKPEIEHKTVEHTEVEHKTAEKKPEIEHKTVEHTEVEHKTVEKKPEVEHKTVEHTEVEHKTVEKKPEVEHKTVEHKTEVEKKTEVKDPKKDPKKDPRKPEETPK